MHVLTYFNAPGRAVITRICLGAAGIPYTYASVPSWSALLELRGPSGASPACPLGSLPVLTLPSGAVVTQSGAHYRYAAKKAGLYPRDDAEAALRIDEVLGICDDVLAKVPQGGEPAAKAAARAAFVADKLPIFFNYLTAQLGAGPFFGGARADLADLAVFALTHGIAAGSWDHVDGQAVMAAYPALAAHLAALTAHPLVVAHGHLADKA